MDADCKLHTLDYTHTVTLRRHAHSHTHFSFRSMWFNPLSCCIITYRLAGASLLIEGHKLISVVERDLPVKRPQLINLNWFDSVMYWIF